jgi:hypothetical protein
MGLYFFTLILRSRRDRPLVKDSQIKCVNIFDITVDGVGILFQLRIWHLAGIHPWELKFEI